MQKRFIDYTPHVFRLFFFFTFTTFQYKFLKRLENMEVTEKDKMVLEVEMEDEDADVTWYRNDAVRDPLKSKHPQTSTRKQR